MADLFDTIAAEATPPGRGAVRVVRISGSKALPILKSTFSAKGPAPWDRPRCLCLGDVGLPGRPPLDRALAVCFAAPDSFTGEDVVEIQAHGAPGVIRGLLDLAGAAGARMALPGEFSYRAYLNGKVTVMEAEAVNALVAAETDGQAAGLGGGLRGGLERDLRQIQEGIMDLRAECEARIDFPEDVETPSLVPVREKVAGLAGELENLLERSSSLRYLREGWRVALVGPVNSGKSSIFNALLRRERALVTPHPGTTRDVLEESLQIGGYPLILIDTAGVRDTEDPIECLGVARGQEVAGLADAALLVFDGHKGWGCEEEVLLGQLPASPLAILANKADLGLTGGPHPEHGEHLAISALTGEGLDALIGRVQAWMEEGAPKGREVFTADRQVETVRRSLEGCRAALQSLEAGESEELAAQGLSLAQRALDECLTGGDAEDLYDRIFSKFCIGK